jgi:hypothetical protein
MSEKLDIKDKAREDMQNEIMGILEGMPFLRCERTWYGAAVIDQFPEPPEELLNKG